MRVDIHYIPQDDLYDGIVTCSDGIISRSANIERSDVAPILIGWVNDSMRYSNIVVLKFRANSDTLPRVKELLRAL